MVGRGDCDVRVGCVCGYGGCYSVFEVLSMELCVGRPSLLKEMTLAKTIVIEGIEPTQVEFTHTRPGTKYTITVDKFTDVD